MQWQVHGMIYTVVVLVSQIFFLCRGETFRSILLRIEEICSLIPEHAHIMALTATERLKKDASRSMGLRNEVQWPYILAKIISCMLLSNLMELKILYLNH